MYAGFDVRRKHCSVGIMLLRGSDCNERRYQRMRKSIAQFDWFAEQCKAALAELYSDIIKDSSERGSHQALSLCLRYLIRLVAVLIAAERIPESRTPARPILEAADVVRDSAKDRISDPVTAFESCLLGAFQAGAPDLLESRGELAISEKAFSEVARLLILPRCDTPVDPLFFETMPLAWLGQTYQLLLSYEPSGDGSELVFNRAGRKRRGVYFTPSYLIDYIVESVLANIADRYNDVLNDGDAKYDALPKILDPAMGSGDFLCGVVEFLAQSWCSNKPGRLDELRAQAAAQCVYGVDIDPVAVEIAQFSVWAASGFADGIIPAIKSHLVCGNAIGPNEGGNRFDWTASFPDVLRDTDVAGFDAVVGNPPYIAKKNGLSPTFYGATAVGQSDSYLLFLSEVLEKRLVRLGGMLSMVLPDPMLVRGNAAQVRRKLMGEWDLVSLLHIAGVFPEAGVASIVPLCRNARAVNSTFVVSRIERVADRRNFAKSPRRTALALSRPVSRQTILAQPRCELLYLLEEDCFGRIVRRIHGDNLSISNFEPPFAPLCKLNVREIYRGEEIGKAAINRETGELPMLLGGQSIKPYEIIWEGRRIDRSDVKKPVDRYFRTKILLQKSSARLIAALDEPDRHHQGYIFPQSVYGIELCQPGMHELYLLCLLNSEVMNEYIRRTATGYKLLQPQIELEDVKMLPIRQVRFITPPPERQADLALAVEIFNNKSLRYDCNASFSELAGFVTACLASNPEKSDVVHDLLVYLGKLIISLLKANRSAPDLDTTRRLESTKRAIDVVVQRLYCTEPAQMSLRL